jgi:hypothetical protein
MKVIGQVDHDTFICEVSHGEVEKFFNLYYDKMKRLKVGDKVDLGKGHDYASQIADALRKTKEFVSANQQVVTAILNGLHYEKIAADNPPPAVQS